MPHVRVKLPTFECLRCGHRWHPKKAVRPARCAFCKSTAWRAKARGPMRRQHAALGCPCASL